jgi:4-hydroxy-3-polyprenylbenzoate decarboxylase
MRFTDLREFIQTLQQHGELKVIEGASPDLEIGGVTQIAAESPKCPALLFDSIKGFPEGHRVLTNALSNRHRERLVFDVPEELENKDAVKYWKEKIKEYKPIAPKRAAQALVKENVLLGDGVDLQKIPWPKWREQDERPVIYGALVILRDLESNGIHAACCSFGLVDSRTIVAHVPSRDIDAIGKQYWSKGQSCPVAVSLGQDPALSVAAVLDVPGGGSVYDFAGWLRSAPVEIIEGDYTGLPIPAAAEVLLEGNLLPPEEGQASIGLMGAASGYYIGGARRASSVRVERLHFRNNPIVVSSPLFGEASHGVLVSKSVSVWNELEEIGIPNIVAVNCCNWGVTIVAIKQPYPGHVKRVAHALLGGTAGQNARFIIVVDEDIDPYNLEKVFWAIVTRYDPASAVDIVRRIWSDEMDPRMGHEKRSSGNHTGSTAIIDACRPYHWMDKFPRTTDISDELLKKTAEKWGRVLRQHG